MYVFIDIIFDCCYHLKVQCVGFRRLHWQEWTIQFKVVFLQVFNLKPPSLPCNSATVALSTVALMRQTKLERAFHRIFANFAATAGYPTCLEEEGECRGVHVVVICNSDATKPYIRSSCHMLLNVHSLGASFVSCFKEEYIVVTRVEKLLK